MRKTIITLPNNAGPKFGINARAVSCVYEIALKTMTPSNGNSHNTGLIAK